MVERPDGPLACGEGARPAGLGKVCLNEVLSGPVIHAVDDHPICLAFSTEDDPVGEVDEMADFE